jgi:hypothetical protein
MRWHDRWKDYELNSIRVRRIFLWRPYYCNGEWRWLERAWLVEEYLIPFRNPEYGYWRFIAWGQE